MDVGLSAEVLGPSLELPLLIGNLIIEQPLSYHF